MRENSFLRKALTETVLTRRSFLKWSAALGGTAALAGGLNYGLQAVKAVTASAAGESKWVPVACWHNCGGRCLLKAQVQDGVVLRVKTDDTHPDSADYPQQRACVRGRSQRMQVFAADRLKYPMKRKNWQPGGGDKSLRGKDEWVRISWGEALDLVAGEIKRIAGQYGNESIYSVAPGRGPAHPGLVWRLYQRLGHDLLGHLDRHPGSRGQLCRELLEHRQRPAAPAQVEADHHVGRQPGRLEQRQPNLQLPAGQEGGRKVYLRRPVLQPTMRVLADEWIPIRPATDAAFLHRHGLCHDHRGQPGDQPAAGLGLPATTARSASTPNICPKGPTPSNNFKDYVLGTYDGVPKTPRLGQRHLRHPAREDSALWPSNTPRPGRPWWCAAAPPPASTTAPAPRRPSSPWPA